MEFRPKAAPLALLALGAAVLFRLWAGPGIVYSGHSDIMNSVVSLSALEQRSLRTEGRFPPPWDPSNNAGQPAHAFPVAQYTSPFHWLYLVLPLDRATNLVVLLYALLSGLTMYACARRFLASPPAAFFCGVAYMLSYRLLCAIDAGWPWALAIYAWTPLLFWALDRVVERPGARRAAEFSAVLALVLIGGYPQLVYDALLGLGLFLAWRLRRAEPRARTAVLLAAGGAATVALLLAAPDLLPRLEFASLSTRTRHDYAFFLGRAPGWADLKTLFSPFDDGGRRVEYWENNFYLGLWLYPLGLYAAFKDRRRARPLLAGLAFMLLLGFDTPLLRLLYRFLPGFNLFRLPARILQLAEFCAVLLAGLGVDLLLRGPWRRRAVLAAALLCLPPLADFGLRARTRLVTRPLSEVLPPPAFPELSRDRPDGGRVAALGRSAVSYGLAGYYGVDMINGYESLNLRHYIDYLFVLQTGDAAGAPRAAPVWTDLVAVAKPDMLRALDVRFIVSNRAVPLEPIGYRLAARRDDVPVFTNYGGVARLPVYLYRDERPLGPAYFARSVSAVRTDAESLAALAAASSVLDARAFGWTGEPLDLDGGRARMTHRGLAAYTYEVDSRGRNFLILSQVWYPGWRARLDGAPLRLYRTNHALLGGVVPSGRHVLELEMTSPPLKAGLALFGLGLALAAGLWAWGVRAGP